MTSKPALVALFGGVIGAVIGWFLFASLAAAAGTGSAFAASIWGALISLTPKEG